MPHDEYMKIKVKLEEKVKNAIKEEKREGMRVRELLEWFIEENLEQIDNQEEARTFTLKVRSIINKLIHQENSLVRHCKQL